MKRSEILREAMKYLAVDMVDYYARISASKGICYAVELADVNNHRAYQAAVWLFGDGKGGRARFFAHDYWLPLFEPQSYTARIMLLELGALMSEEEGQ